MSSGFYEQEPLDSAQLQELEDALNAVTSDPAWKHKIVILPPSNLWRRNIMLSMKDGGVRFTCSCGWTWFLLDEHTEASLEFAIEAAKHACNPEVSDG